MVDKVVKQCMEDLKRINSGEIKNSCALEYGCDGYYTITFSTTYSPKVFEEARALLSGETDEEKEKKELLAFLQAKYYSLIKEAEILKEEADKFARQSKMVKEEAEAVKYQILSSKP